MEKKGPRKELFCLSFLITVGAGIHSIVEVHRVWGVMSLIFSDMINTSYICMFSSSFKNSEICKEQ
jgi:hypothetical protein